MKKLISRLFIIISAFFGRVGNLRIYLVIFCFIFPSACALYPRVSIEIKLGENLIAETIRFYQPSITIPEIEEEIRDNLEQITLEAIRGEKSYQIENLRKMGMNCKDDKIDCYYYGYIAYDMSHRDPGYRYLKIEFYYLVMDKNGKIDTNFKMFRKYSAAKFN